MIYIPETGVQTAFFAFRRFSMLQIVRQLSLM